MHEAGLARAAVAALLDATAGRSVHTVVLAAGSGVDIDSAAATWQAAASGTRLEGTRVEWRRAPDQMRCFSCGREYSGGRLDACPLCGGNGFVVRAADELAVVDWET